VSAPTTHDPLVVNTKDGVTWLRRAVTQDGQGLYAVTDSCKCPEYLMATLAELAEHGIAGSADALPMPVGPEPSELERLRTQRDNWKASFEAERQSRNEELGQHNEEFRAVRVAADGWKAQFEALRARVAELEAERAGARPVDEDPIRYELTPQAEESADRLTRLFAPTQALRLRAGERA
jgi:hypothetical protein